VVRTFPGDIYDSLLLNGYTAEVWMEPGLAPDELYGTMGTFYDEPAPSGAVSLVLGAGNIASIAPLDVLYKLYAEGQVCILKLNPVNAYLGPVFEEMFHDFVVAGYLRFAYGGADVGALLTRNPGIDEIHVTGSGQTFDAIVFGAGPDGAARKASDTPEIDKRVTSELGGISPAIVIPGVWSEADLRFQAEHVVTQKMHNGGFNCIATQVLLVAEGWPQRAAFLAAVEEVFRTLPDRPAYYPGAAARLGHALEHCAGAHTFGAGNRALLTLPDATGDHDAFKTEYFAGALAVVSLPETTAAGFFDAAVAFCNDRLAGTLGASVIVHPDTLKALGDGFERGLAALRYGTVGVNVWSGAGFLLPSACWGAFPGHTRADIQSGTGVVHNSFLFARPQRTVVRGPFAPFPRTLGSGHLHLSPKPLWFVTNTTAATTARRVTHFAADPSPLGLPAIFASALRG
jgi:aldehyde dehydrogenase (NAD(P)+)